MPDIQFVQKEIERMRVQVQRQRQRREIMQLQRAGIPTASANGCSTRSLISAPSATGCADEMV
jgi:hypothetical protein